jgi:hypothetical protein
VKLSDPQTAEAKVYRLNTFVSSINGREELEAIHHRPIQVNPNARSYSPEHIKGLSSANLTEKQLEFLRTNGFVVTNLDFPSFVALYRDNQKNNIPSFVTIDTAISGLSHILAKLRVDLEREVFLSKLTAFTNILREQLLLLHPKVPTSCKNASLRALAFIKVASILLNCDEKWPPEIEQKIQGVVDKEILLIYNGREQKTVGIQDSPIFDYSIDYNRFKIRWDETKDEELRRYYQAMEWYSRCVFRTSHLAETQSALLILMAAIGDSGDAINIWDEMHQLLTALYGEADDLHLLDYQRIAREVYGDTITPAAITQEKLLRQFCRQTDKEKLPRIRSEVGLKGGLRIFGGRYYARDMILQQLCYPYVGDQDDPRVIPNLLDIAVIMNQPKAMEIAQEKDFFRFVHYQTKVKNYQITLQQEMDRSSKPWANGGLVTDAWIYKPMTQPEGKGYPYFCRSDAWQARKLGSMLCGLIHLANSKPTFSGKKEGSFTGVSDPYPEFFNRMLTTLRNRDKLLQVVGYPRHRPPAQEIIAYQKALEAVVVVATQMLSGEIVTQEQQDRLGNFVLGWEGDEHEANIHELSTLFHRNDTQVDYYLHAGVEPVREIWVACPSPSGAFLARGGIYMLYVFSTSQKISPEHWRNAKLWKTVKQMRGLEEVAPWQKPFAGGN